MKSKLFKFLISIISFLDLHYNLFLNKDKCFDLVMDKNYFKYNERLNLDTHNARVRILKATEYLDGSHCIVKILNEIKEPIPYTGKFKIK